MEPSRRLTDLSTSDTVSFMTDEARETTSKTLPCGCQARTARDFLGRVVGTVEVKGAQCAEPRHALGQAIVMPGREHARPE
ncbi:MAG: hypothetical protein A3I61_05575 [Acidobacteria bacterium RIFCSPLOWO2_02_FULL_68_18]|nr:MAG: hypothetical protein A3I61_05575 [Acidobacteria bacterium RIFCSPLOWO2_02_FULL_68_18]